MTITAIVCVLRSERSQRLYGNQTSAFVTIAAIECFQRSQRSQRSSTIIWKLGLMFSHPGQPPNPQADTIFHQCTIYRLLFPSCFACLDTGEYPYGADLWWKLLGNSHFGTFRLNPAFLTSSRCLKKENLATTGRTIILPSGALLTLPIL